MIKSHLDSQKRSKMIKRLMIIVALMASALFMGYNLYTNWKKLCDYHWRFDFYYLFLATVALVLAFMSNVGGWSFIINRLGGTSSFRENMEIYCLAAHGKRIPGLVWYVAGRIYLYERVGVPASVTVQASLWEIILQMLSGLAIYIVFWPLYREGQYRSFNYFLLAAIPLLLLTFSPTAFKHLLRRVRQIKWERKIVQVDWSVKTFWFIIYFLGGLAGGSILYFLTKAVSSATPSSLLPVCWGFVALSGAISSLTFFLPSGAGVREVSLSLLLSSYVPLPVAIALSLLFRVWILVGETILLVLLWSAIKGYSWGFRQIIQKDY
jgi:glycosyltransferase 2 family protein